MTNPLQRTVVRLKRLVVRTVKPVVGPRRWDQLTSGVRRRRVARRTTPEPATTERPSLTELGVKARTDKATKHHYTRRYEQHFAHLRDERFTLLEIGIGGYGRANKGGRSLRMWKNYFSHAAIVGLDIEDKSFLDQRRIHTYRGSQVDHDVLDRILGEVAVGELRVVIDDGSHVPAHVRDTFAYLFPRLPDGALYAIEDTQTSYYPSFGGAMDLDDPRTSMALVKRLLDGLNWEEWIDPGDEPAELDTMVTAVHAYHNLVVIEKGTNHDGTNRKPAWRPSTKEAGAQPR